MFRYQGQKVDTVRLVAVKPVLAVTCVPGSAGITVAAKHGSTTLTGVTDSNGYVEIPVSGYGSWEVSAEIGGEEVSRAVVVSEVSVYPVVLQKTMIFGVQWDGSSSTVLTRTDDAALFDDPVAAVGTGSGSSPFDSLYPWSEMEEYNVIDGEIAYKRGDAGFSRADYDTVVYIPEFYYQRPDANTFRISNVAASGFEKHPGSGKYIGKYFLGTNGSVSGSSFSSYATKARASSACKAKGAKWELNNFAVSQAIRMLYLVEYANFNAQAVLGNGAAGNNGLTDAMVYHTGNNGGAVQYRGIESLYFNGWEIVAGLCIYGDNKEIYISGGYSDDISDYIASGVSTKGKLTNTKSCLITSISLSEEAKWAIIPSAFSLGEYDTYLSDGVYGGGYSGTNYNSALGGHSGLSSTAGMFSMYLGEGDLGANGRARPLFDPSL